MSSIKKIVGGYFVRCSKGTGKNRKFINRKIRGTLKDAQRFAREQETMLDLGIFPETESITANKFFDIWLEASEPQIQPVTYDFYVNILKHYVRPLVGEMLINDIKPHHLQDILTAMRRKGLSATTIRHAHTTVTTALNYAVKMDYLSVNPAAKVDPPKKSKKEIKVLSIDEAQRFIEACGTVKNGLIFELALETGARPEEYLALRWRDVDFSHNAISIVQAVIFRAAGYYFCDTKTKKSRRLIPVSVTLRDKLLKHRIEQNDWRVSTGVDLNPLDLVFVNQLGSPFALKYLRRDYFPQILAKAGLGHFTIYSLRHSCATLLLQAGINIKVVSERLGHSSISISLDLYCHVMPNMQVGATEGLDNVLRLKKG